MRTFLPSTRTTSWMLALTSTLLFAACGGGKEPILGMGQLVTLAPSVSATAPLASNPVVTGVATNTRIAASFNKPMSPIRHQHQHFYLAMSSGREYRQQRWL